MKKQWNWQLLINPAELKGAIAWIEVTKVLKVALEKLVNWRDWNGRLLAVISGKGGRFVGYWQLPTTIKWLVKAIANWTDEKSWPILEKTIRMGLKRYRYAPEAGAQIVRALQQKNAYFARKANSHRWADALIRKFRDCQTLEAIEQLNQLFWRQRRLYEQFPEAIRRVMAVAEQQTEAFAGCR